MRVGAVDRQHAAQQRRVAGADARALHAVGACCQLAGQAAGRQGPACPARCRCAPAYAFQPPPQPTSAISQATAAPPPPHLLHLSLQLLLHAVAPLLRVANKEADAYAVRLLDGVQPARRHPGATQDLAAGPRREPRVDANKGHQALRAVAAARGAALRAAAALAAAAALGRAALAAARAAGRTDARRCQLRLRLLGEGADGLVCGDGVAPRLPRVQLLPQGRHLRHRRRGGGRPQVSSWGWSAARGERRAHAMAPSRAGRRAAAQPTRRTALQGRRRRGRRHFARLRGRRQCRACGARGPRDTVPPTCALRVWMMASLRRMRSSWSGDTDDSRNSSGDWLSSCRKAPSEGGASTSTRSCGGQTGEQACLERGRGRGCLGAWVHQERAHRPGAWRRVLLIGMTRHLLTPGTQVARQGLPASA